MLSLKSQGLRRTGGDSSYFQGRYARYGKYQWNVKYYGFNDEYEPEMVCNYYLGERVKLKQDGYGFERLNEILGREVEAYLDGRSGGWLVIDSDLSEDELVLIDSEVDVYLKTVKEFLKHEREFNQDD